MVSYGGGGERGDYVQDIDRSAKSRWGGCTEIVRDEGSAMKTNVLAADCYG